MNHRNYTVESYRICFIVTSDSVYRGLRDDDVKPIANSIANFCKGAVLSSYQIVPNNIAEIQRRVIECTEGCDIIIVTGGTGISRRDVSIEAIREIAWRELPGFGELFRLLSYKEVGIAAYLSRATAYIVKDTIVFIVPGNPNAIRLALDEIICLMAPHAIYELKRQ